MPDGAHPLVSVVVTAYNQAAYVGAALDSVLGQTLRPFEVIVIDDGSSDGTRDVIRGYGESVRAVFQENRGVAAARNAGVRLAHGEFVAFLDGDDLWSPEKLEIQVDVARAHPRSGLVAVDGVEFDGEGVLKESLFDGLEPTEPGASPVVSGRFYRDLLRLNLVATTSQVLIPARVLAEVGASDERLAVASDYELYLRIAARHDLTFVRKPLVSWRYQASSASGPRARREFRWREEDMRVLRKQLDQCAPGDRPVVRMELARVRTRTAQRAYVYGRQGDYSWSLSYLLGFVVRNPSFLGAVYLARLAVPAPVVRLADAIRAAGQTIRA